MKFGKLLKSKADEMEGAGEHFLRYKELKKALKGMKGASPEAVELENTYKQLDDSEAPQTSGRDSEGHSGMLTAEERSFIETLKQDMGRFNDFFIDQEESFIIRTQSLNEQARLAKDPRQRDRVRSAYVDLHGEMVLLMNWSCLNYAALVKILKKHDKQSDVLLRTPFLATVLQQPFYSTERITELVKDAEAAIKQMLREGGGEDAAPEVSSPAASPTKPKSSIDATEALLVKRTQAALQMWKDMGEKASTPSTVMPPPKRPRQSETQHQADAQPSSLPVR